MLAPAGAGSETTAIHASLPAITAVRGDEQQHHHHQPEMRDRGASRSRAPASRTRSGGAAMAVKGAFTGGGCRARLSAMRPMSASVRGIERAGDEHRDLGRRSRA